MKKQHHKQLKKYITWGMLALLVLLLAAMPLIAGETAPADGPLASILHTAAEARTIHTQLIGGGQLSSNATEEITIPAGIKLTGYLVGNGDIVKRGDAIAEVDRISVLSALEEVQQTLDYLAGELADAASSPDTGKVTAHAGGLVKVLYGQSGDNVREVMLEHGALALLSLDGRMAVEISRSTNLKTGTSVCVCLEDGAEVEGRVESSAAGSLVVSIEDAGYAIGKIVTVKTEEGQRLGSGSLYVHNAWHAIAYDGTITKVNGQEGDTISAGKALFELEAGDYSANFQVLTAQRQEYEELMAELFRMYDSGIIAAPCDGIVTGVDTKGSFLLSTPQTFAPQVQLLCNVVWNPPSVIMLSQVSPADPTLPSDVPSVEEAPGICTGSDECQADTHHPGCPLYVPPHSGYAAKVVELTEQSAILSYLGTPDSQAPADPVYQGLTYPDGTPIAVGDIVILYLDGTIKKESGASGSQMPGMDDISGMMGAMAGGMGGMGSSVPVFEPYSLETLAIASVTSQEEMTLEITVDEQDIAGLYPGMEATVTVEALTGQNFPATVTSVSNTGTNEGGSSKFTAKLTLNRSGDMLPGMNASAFLTLDSAEQVLSLPVAALVEDGSRTIVYTAYQEKDQLLKNPVEVTTGVSDGEYVQILSGLAPGDTVYYAYYDTPEISNIPDAGSFPF